MATFKRQRTGHGLGISDGGKTAKAIWDAEPFENAEDVIRHADVPIHYNDPWPDDRNSKLRCTNLEVSYQGGKLYHIAGTFSIKKDGGGGGARDGDPLKEPARIQWDEMRINEQIEYDSEGNPITTSAGRGFDTPVSRDFVAYRLTVTRNERRFDLAKSLAFSNRVNSDVFAGAKPGEVLCTSILPAADYPEDAVFVPIRYVMIFMPSSLFGDQPHQARVLDQDTFGLADINNRKKLVQIASANGQAIDRPALLNGKGKPLDKTLTYLDEGGTPVEEPAWSGRGKIPSGAILDANGDKAVFLKYIKTYPSAALNALGLPL